MERDAEIDFLALLRPDAFSPVDLRALHFLDSHGIGVRFRRCIAVVLMSRACRTNPTREMRSFRPILSSSVTGRDKCQSRRRHVGRTIVSRAKLKIVKSREAIYCGLGRNVIPVIFEILIGFFPAIFSAQNRVSLPFCRELNLTPTYYKEPFSPFPPCSA